MKEEKKLLIQLIRLAEADADLKHSEYKFLRECARLLKISREELDTLFVEHIASKPPAMEADRIVQFYRLVLLANVDQEVNEQEMIYLREAGFHLGLNPDAVESVFTEMKKSETGEIPTQRLLEIFKVYHN